MANPKSTATLIAIAAIALAGVAAYMIYSYLGAKEQESQQARMDVARIVVAAADIEYGTQLKPELMKVSDWPRANLPPGHAANPEALNGRLTLASLKAGSPILEGQLAPVDTAGGIMPYMILPGFRAITVAVNEVVGVAGFVLPNSIVDVVATVNSPFMQGDDSRISKIVLQGVKVLAVGQIMEQKEGKPVIVPTVTLLVTPENAEKLVLASENRVQLILRHMGDTDETKTKGATIVTLLGGPPPAEAKNAPPRSSGGAYRPAAKKADYIEVIKGGERSKVEPK